MFNSTRFHPLKNHEEMLGQIKQTVKSLALDKIKLPKEVITDLESGDGKIIEINGNKVGVYRKGNNFYTIDPVCSHLGCELSFNGLEKTWDCPCHGSRFTYTGKHINGPAVKDLESVQIGDDL